MRGRSGLGRDKPGHVAADAIKRRGSSSPPSCLIPGASAIPSLRRSRGAPRRVRPPSAACGHARTPRRGGNPGDMPTGPVDLDGPIDDAAHHVRRHHLDHGDLGASGLVAHGIHHVRGVQSEEARLVDLHAAFRDDVPGDALIGERPAERPDARVARRQRRFQRTLRDADCPHAMVDAARAEPALRDLEAATLAEQDIRDSARARSRKTTLRVAVRCIVVAEDASWAARLVTPGVSIGTSTIDCCLCFSARPSLSCSSGSRSCSEGPERLRSTICGR